MKKYLLIPTTFKVAFILCALFFGCEKTGLHSQNGQPLPPEDSLWPIIETQLDESPEDTSINFIYLLVRGKCLQDTNCLIRNYAEILDKVEDRHNMSASIQVAHELINVAGPAGRMDVEAYNNLKLFCFQDALGHRPVAINYLERSIELYTILQDFKPLMVARTFLLEYQLVEQSYSTLKPQVEELLTDALKVGDTTNFRRINMRMIEHALAAEELDDAERHLKVVEEAIIPNPSTAIEKRYIQLSALGRAELSTARGEYESAEQYFKKGIELSHEYADPWQVVHMTQKLAAVKWRQEEPDTARALLKEAQLKAEELKLHNLLADNFALQAEIAEAENLHAEALAFTKKKIFHHEEFEKRGAGFDMEKYKLEQEKKRLAAVKERQAVELMEKEAQIQKIVSFSLVGLAVIAGLLLFIFWKRKRSDVKTETIPAVRHEPRAFHLPAMDETAQPGPSTSLSSREAEWLKRFEAHVQKNLADDTMSVPLLARHFAMSESSLLRQLKKLTGMTPQKFIRRTRMEEARKLLEEKEYDSVAKVASKVGYADTRSFSRSFKKQFGKLPSEFIND